MEYALLVAFLVSNGIWLLYMVTRDKQDKSERQELLNRIAHPEIIFQDELSDPVAPEPPPDLEEYAAVGAIDPVGIKRGDNE